MKNLNYDELREINGGNVPTAYYMDSDVIQANWNGFKPWLSIVGRTLVGLGKEIIRAVAL
jgi:hypothetical protein